MLNWYLQNGKEADVVVSSRIRFARNLADFPFETKCSKKHQEEILKMVEEAIPSIGYGLKVFRLSNMDDITKMSLVEKHLVSPNFILKEKAECAIGINEDENICMMINEEDHLRIQFFAAGLELENLLQLAIEVDEKIGNILTYAYHEKYGFLTACPTNVGTGMRASVMVHLPGLAETGNMNKILEVMSNFGMNIRGMYGEGSKVLGDRYQISNKQSLGLSEQEIIKNLKLITSKVIEQERLARHYLVKNELDLEDQVYRAYGILSYCKKLSSSEATELLSQVKLGTDLGLITQLTDLKVKKMDLYSKPANLQKYYGKQYEEEQRDKKRAELIEQIIAEE